MSTSPYYNKIQVDVKIDGLEQQIANVADGTAGKAYPNLTTAMAVTPLPEDGVIFTIDEDNETEAGVYAYDSNEVDGYRFVRELGAKGKVEEGNTQAVSGGEVYESQKLLQTKSDLTLKTKTKTVVGALNEVNSQISIDPTYGLDQSKRHLFDGKILAMWGDALPSYPIYISILQNITTGLGPAIYIRKEEAGDFIASFRDQGATSPRTGIEDIYLSPLGGSGFGFYMKVNWDNISSNNLADDPIEIFSLPKEEIVNEDNKTILDVLHEYDEEIDGLSNRVEVLTGLVKVPISGVIGGDTSLIDSGVIKDIYVNTNENGENIYLSRIRNLPSQRLIIQFLEGDTGIPGETPVAYQLHPTEIFLRTGVQTYEITRVYAGGNHPILYVTIDWGDLGVLDYSKDGGRLAIDTSLLNTQPNLQLLEQVNELDQRVTVLENQETQPIDELPLPVSPFGKLPDDFRLKMAKMEKDLEILVVGDSIVGNIRELDENPNPEQSLPGYLNEHFSFRIWDLLCHNKPVFDRLDSQRGGSDFFTKTGTWSYIVGGKLNSTPTSNSGEYSDSSGTFQSNDTDAEVQFQIDTDAYEKFNIVHGLHPDATDAVVNVSEGDNQFEVSIDKSNWQEANGFVVAQKTESSVSISITGYAYHQRHRRLWFRKKSGVTGVKNISFKKNTSNNDYLYFWGIEKWNGNTIFLTNLGRGGRRIELLNRNITDVIDRNPDLVIFSLPMNNDSSYDYTDIEFDYNAYFFGGDDVGNYRYERSLFFKSNEYQDFSVVAMLPTGRTQEWNGNQITMNTFTDIYPYQKFKKVYGFLDENNTFENLKVINIYDYIISEAKARGMTVEDALAPGGFTRDGVHLNQLGSDLYVKYLVGLFNV